MIRAINMLFAGGVALLGLAVLILSFCKLGLLMAGVYAVLIVVLLCTLALWGVLALSYKIYKILFKQ